ncbi:Mg2+ transporter like zinc transport [Fusarium phyllophilum]|uniref:Mg2+ transporter like zinc transport n=1 Tax=Fusarium phyllophilum TaxID=47803 RepID=A0A8H5KA63_9HYPO|nr:Mg2+ transporter like zinc transport [Fusarium phyllophilum]
MAKPKQVQVHQVFDSRYYDGVKMQRILENLFPERKGNFGLRMMNDQWAFRAPRQVTRTDRMNSTFTYFIFLENLTQIPSLSLVSMDMSHPCFVNEVTEPIRVISTGAGVSEEEHSGAEVHQFSTLEQMQSHFSRTETLEQPYHFIPMLSFLVDKFKLNPSIWDVASCFYAKDFDVESTFCVPFTVSRDGPITEVSYTIRYPEFKAAQGTWIIRQSGIYQRFNNETKQNLCALFNPIPGSKLHQLVQDYVSKVSRNVLKDVFWPHKEVFKTYFSSWRLYNVYLEKRLLPIANKAVATWIEELTEAEYRHLTDLSYLETRLLQILAILGSSNELLEGLSSLCRNWYPDSTGHDRESAVSGLTEFQNHQLNCRVYVRTAEYLQKLTEKNTQLLANTLSFREQLYAKGQNDNMLRLNKSAVFITTLTLLYLPASFAATFFGMNFFDLDDSGDQIVMTSMIWIYFLSSAGLTIGTFLLYHVLLDKTLIGRIVGNVPIVKTLVRGRSRKESSDMELGSME